MSGLVIAPIVEGHGEVEAVPVLLRRLAEKLLGQPAIEVLRPIRQRRSQLVIAEKVERFVTLACHNLERRAAPGSRRAVLLLLDADDDCPAELGPRLAAICRTIAGETTVMVVLANREFETWFVGSAAAQQMRELLELREAEIPAAPEDARAGKMWIEDRFNRRHRTTGQRYSPVVDMPKLVARLDPALARERCPSFDKLCRELEAWGR